MKKAKMERFEFFRHVSTTEFYMEVVAENMGDVEGITNYSH